VDKFWASVFQRAQIQLAHIAAYHPSADGQAERTNQVVNAALRCTLVGKHEEIWDIIVPQVELSLTPQ
jgi:hypothetical protein